MYLFTRINIKSGSKFILGFCPVLSTRSTVILLLSSPPQVLGTMLEGSPIQESGGILLLQVTTDLLMVNRCTLAPHNRNKLVNKVRSPRICSMHYSLNVIMV